MINPKQLNEIKYLLTVFNCESFVFNFDVNSNSTCTWLIHEIYNTITLKYAFIAYKFNVELFSTKLILRIQPKHTFN